jgi:hypothetical protein
LRSRKSPKVSSSQVSSNDAVTVERRTKALKTNEHDCSFQKVRSSRKTRKRSTASCEKSEIEAAINSSGEKISRRQHDPSEEMQTLFQEEEEKSSSRSSNQSGKDLSLPFEKRIEELRAFKAKFGHCNVTKSTSASNKPYLSLGRWCSHVRRSRRLIEEGNQKQYPMKLSNAEIEHLDAVGFQWKLKIAAFDKHIEELRAFKAKFGHCNVTESLAASNKPYLSLGGWCSKVRRSRRLIEEGKQKQVIVKLSNAQIERLDAVGFQWESNYATFDDRIEELRVFKAKFGHCNVTLSKSASNKPYLSLGRWCSQVRCSRRLIEEGNQKQYPLKLSNAQIERLDAVEFQWKLENGKCF